VLACVGVEATVVKRMIEVKREAWVRGSIRCGARDWAG
jgi:hypothetical protein